MIALSGLSFLRFESPHYLALLALIPLFLALSLRSLAGLGRVRGGLAVGLRCAVVALLVLALAGLQAVDQTDDQTVAFVLDASSSVPREAQRRGFEFVRDACQSMRAGKDRVAYIVFAGAPSVEQPSGPALAVDRVGSAPRPDGTDIAAGLRIATAILPPDTARRLVLLSDGNENAGDAVLEAQQLRASATPVDVVPLTYVREHEVVFERLSGPGTARVDETITLNALLRTTQRVRGSVRVYQNDELVQFGSRAAQPVQLEDGPNRLSIPVPLREPGVHRFRAVFEPDRATDDGIVQNNEAHAFTVVGGRERVLIVADTENAERPDERESALLLAAALEREGIPTVVQPLGATPLDSPLLMAYSCVVLNNVSAIRLGPDEQAALAAYVRDLGGGLVVLGGDQAFSVGGYFGTPLEAVLPVETDRRKLVTLSLAMVIVLDRSGSMAGEKLDLAKGAATGAVRLLSRLDKLGVVVFDSASEWAIPLGPCENRAVVESRLAQVGVGGGTDMYPALEQAAVALQSSNANLRHVILLTDGQSAPGDFEGIAQRFASASITLSAIAVGSDADRNLLHRLADRTGGRMYVTESAKPLPQIFARETMLAGRSGLFEKAFAPVQQTALPSPVVGGFEQADWPRLAGHVITAAKPLAQVPLVRAADGHADPILAHWHVGLGRTVAFTSGMWPRWGADWVAWPGFSKLWSQVIRWASRSANSIAFDARISVDGDRATVTLEAAPEVNTSSGAVRLEGRVLDPSLQSHALTLDQTGPNRFEGSFVLREHGNYIVRVAFASGLGTKAVSGLVQAGISHSYSQEWRDLRSNEARLVEIARCTHGRVLNPQHPAAVFEPWSIRPVQSRRLLWEDLVRTALLLFVADVAVRRLALSPRRAWTGMRGFVADLAGKSAAPSAETFAALQDARARIREQSKSKEDSAIDGPSASELCRSSDVDVSHGIDDGRPFDAASPGHVPRPTAAPPDDPTDYLKRLRRAKRRARGEQED